MKKNAILILVLFGFIVSGFSQIKFGVKAGLNYNSGENISFTDVSNVIFDFSPDDKIGFHAGVWLQGKISTLGLYVRPEFVYTQIQSSYNLTSGTGQKNDDFTLQKLDVPILVGTKVFSLVNVFIGPSFQFVVDSDFNVATVTAIETDEFSLGIQLGFGVELGKLGVDLRWERGLSDTNSEIVLSNLTNKIVVDARPNQIILGFSYRLGE